MCASFDGGASPFGERDINEIYISENSDTMMARANVCGPPLDVESTHRNLEDDTCGWQLGMQQNSIYVFQLRQGHGSEEGGRVADVDRGGITRGGHCRIFYERH